LGDGRREAASLGHSEPIELALAGSTAVQSAGPRETDPARFLTDVMNDGTAPLALRIEAARILLSCAQRA
jgi:hypothetical protein